jgi:chaperonin cofactor prefoldin
MAAMRTHLAKMKEKMKQLKSNLNSDEFEHSDSKDNEIRWQMMNLADDMEDLNKKMKNIHKKTEEVDKKVQAHHKKIRKMIYDHNKKIEDTIDHDDFTEEDFMSAK